MKKGSGFREAKLSRRRRAKTTNSKRWSLAGILTAYAALLVGPVMVTYAAPEYLAQGAKDPCTPTPRLT
jgi:hypothetical protein